MVIEMPEHRASQLDVEELNAAPARQALLGDREVLAAGLLDPPAEPYNDLTATPGTNRGPIPPACYLPLAGPPACQVISDGKKWHWLALFRSASVPSRDDRQRNSLGSVGQSALVASC